MGLFLKAKLTLDFWKKYGTSIQGGVGKLKGTEGSNMIATEGLRGSRWGTKVPTDKTYQSETFLLAIVANPRRCITVGEGRPHIVNKLKNI